MTTKASLIDLNGNEMILDADGDTTITADTDDQLDIKVAGSDKVQINATGLGIGQVPTRDLSLHAGDASSVFAHFTNTDTGTTSSDGLLIGLGSSEDLVLNNQESSKNIIFENGGSERLRIASSGELSLGVTANNTGGTGDINMKGNQAIRWMHATDGTQYGDMYVDTSNNVVFRNTSSSTERMRIDSSGKVGIGMTPTHQLSVVGTGAATAINIGSVGSSFPDTLGMFVSSTAHTQTAYGDLNIKARTDYGGYYGIGFFTASSNNTPTLRMKIDSSGIIFTTPTYNDTTANSANVVVASNGRLSRSTSSRKYKNTITDATKGLAEVKTLRPVTYKSNNDGDTVFYGLIAEEVHDAGLTEFVEYNADNEPDALRYSNMVSICIKAIQEQQEQIESLQQEIEVLKND